MDKGERNKKMTFFQKSSKKNAKNCFKKLFTIDTLVMKDGC